MMQALPIHNADEPIRVASLSPFDVAETQDAPMPAKRRTNVYPTGSGWVYEVWFEKRVIVIGCCATFEAATRAAAVV
jgi:hypothetical protein